MTRLLITIKELHHNKRLEEAEVLERKGLMITSIPPELQKAIEDWHKNSSFVPENFYIENHDKDCDSFDNLVYKEPEEDCYIPYDSLSDEQKDFILSTLKFYKNAGHNEEHATKFRYCTFMNKWYTHWMEDPSEKMANFNDIFVSK